MAVNGVRWCVRSQAGARPVTADFTLVRGKVVRDRKTGRLLDKWPGQRRGQSVPLRASEVGSCVAPGRDQVQAAVVGRPARGKAVGTSEKDKRRMGMLVAVLRDMGATPDPLSDDFRLAIVTY